MNVKLALDSSLKKMFQEAIIKYYNEKGRYYPWRTTNDPFRILIAEILLKRTGAWKAEAVYQEIIGKYPNPKSLSEANVSDLEEAIRPLGLITRARLLVEIAKEIVNRYHEKVPDDFSQLTSLRGMGRYTANAVLCFGYNRKVPLVDESIKRVFVRCLNFQSSKPAYCDNELWDFATELLPEKHVKEYNLGLLDLGANFCKHSDSLCLKCPLEDFRYKQKKYNS